MTSLKTILGTAGVAVLTSTFSAQAQETTRPYAVTRECARHALQKVFTPAAEIVETPDGLAVTRTQTIDKGRQAMQSAIIKLAPDGKVERLNVQTDLADFSAAVTYNYTKTPREVIKVSSGATLPELVAQSSLERLDAELRGCQTVVIGGLNPHIPAQTAG